MSAVLERFGYTDLSNKLNGSGIHYLDNVMIVTASFHASFDALAIWFVETVRRS